MYNEPIPIVWLPQQLWSNHKEYGLMDHMDPMDADNKNTT